jgi:hypothetical protein
LWSGCASSPAKPERPENANVEVTRPAVSGKILGDTPVTIRRSRVPLLNLRDGETQFGYLEPGKYTLNAISPDPYRFSDFGSNNWQSQPFELVIEKGKNYKLEVLPMEGGGWVIRQAPID